MITEAVILAAGKGNRMRTSDNPEIKNTPKALLQTNGKTIIEHQIERMVEAGIQKIIVVVSPEKENLFRQKLSKYRNITFCHQREPLGTGHALYCAKDNIENDLFLVTMGDDKIIHNLKELLDFSQPIVCGFEVDDVSNFGLIKIKNGEFEKIIEKSASGRGLANTGVYVMPKDFFDVYHKISPNEKNGEYYLTDAPELLKKLGHNFRVFKLDFWMGVNCPQDLTKANS